MAKFSTSIYIAQTCSNRFLTIQSVFLVKKKRLPGFFIEPIDSSLGLCWPGEFLPMSKNPFFGPSDWNFWKKIVISNKQVKGLKRLRMVQGWLKTD